MIYYKVSQLFTREDNIRHLIESCTAVHKVKIFNVPPWQKLKPYIEVFHCDLTKKYEKSKPINRSFVDHKNIHDDFSNYMIWVIKMFLWSTKGRFIRLLFSYLLVRSQWNASICGFSFCQRGTLNILTLWTSVQLSIKCRILSSFVRSWLTLNFADLSYQFRLISVALKDCLIFAYVLHSSQVHLQT
jgi:hypothetical protein